MKKAEHEFCMKHFKVSIALLLALIVVVVGWTAWHCGSGPRRELEIALAAAATPTAPPIDANAKMTHPYWGNCSKCHVTTGAGKPVSKVMAGAPISVKAKMPHKYWGNCLLCHKITDGVQPAGTPGISAKAAALNRITAQTLGLKLQSVDAAMMQNLGLANEDGVLVVDVQPGSIAAQAGLQKGDEIIRVEKLRVENLNDFEAALGGPQAGSNVKFAIYSGKRKRNLNLRLPDGLPETMPVNPAQVAAAPPMGQNIGQTPPPVDTRLVAANLNFGKVAVGSMGPGVNYPVSTQFSTSPYFIVFDPAQNTYSSVSNPNTRTSIGQDVQTGQYIVDLGASNVIAGSFAPDAVNTLTSLRVTLYPGVTGSVRNVLSAYVAGRLSPMTAGSNLTMGSPAGVRSNPGRKVQTLF
ncbi:MAG: magnetochrome domain-containing protein [Syntrophobacteraceae bacterium]